MPSLNQLFRLDNKVALVTGGCGFIGAHLVRRLLSATDHRVINLDRLTYAADESAVDEFAAHDRHRFVHGDICDHSAVNKLFADFQPNAVMHLAAESHVDRSIVGPAAFVETNVVGTQVLLDAAREHKVSRFVQVSTDEVYGSLGETGRFSETSPIT